MKSLTKTKVNILFYYLLLTISLLFIFTGCSLKNKSSSEKNKDNTLKVGMECDYNPFNYTTTKKGKYTLKLKSGGYCDGYDVRIAEKIATSLGKKLEVVKTEWDGLTPSLTSNKIDLIIAGMSPTKKRKKTIDFSSPYYQSDLVLVVRKDSKYINAKKISDFSNAAVTGQLNTFHYDVIDQIKNVKKVSALNTFPEMIVALRSKKIDAYVSERPGALAAIKSNKDLTYVSFDKKNGFKTKEEDTSIAIGVKKGNKDLLNKVNKALSKISNLERQKIMEDIVNN